MSIVFEAKGTPFTRDDIQNAAVSLGGDQAALWSLMAVETQGFGFLQDRRPCILFERHIFHLRTGGKYDREDPNLSNPSPGGYLGGAAEYDRLGRAMQLDERAALESASWGLGQMMGYNAATAGFTDVYAMVAAMIAGEAAQLRATANFITADPPLYAALRDRNWARVAFNYNGAGYARNHYDEKLEQNYQLFSTAAGLPDIDVRTAQACLFYLDYLPDGVDGQSGPRTRKAVLAFRLRNGLPPGDLDANVTGLLRGDADI
jgi:N-acetylmuramidase/Putative peptidoglycan binding domain